MKGNSLDIVRKLRNARFQPPQGGPREKLRWISDGEANLLRKIGGSGKRGKFGFESYGLGDKGNSVGSNGASNYSGDGKGGQVNLNGTGMGQANVLRQVNGRWGVVSRAEAARIDSGGAMRPAARTMVRPASAPLAVAQPVAAPVAPAEIYMDPQIAGRLQAAQLSPTKAFPARPTVIAPNSFNTSARPSSFPARPSVTAPNSFNASARPSGAAGEGSGGGGGSGWGDEMDNGSYFSDIPTHQATAPERSSSDWSPRFSNPMRYTPNAPVKDQSRLTGKADDRLPGMTGATPPTPAYDPALAGNATYTPQAINSIRHKGGWIPDPVDAPRPMTPSRKGFTKSEMFRRGIVNDAQHRSSGLNRSRMAGAY